MDGEPESRPEAPEAPAAGPAPADELSAAPETPAGTPAERVETAVSPVIRGDSVSIPTPAWGVAVPDDIETVEAELVDPDAVPELDGEHMPETEWSALAWRWPGWSALAAAVATAIVTGIAVAVDAGHDSGTATVLAWVAIGLSIAAFLGGVLAAVFNRGRVSGVIAAIVGIFADPWVLLQVLTLLGG